MKPNKLLLIIVLICITPMLILSTNNDVTIVSQLPAIKTTVKMEKTNVTSALGLAIDDDYFDIKIKIPNYKVSIDSNQNIIITSENTSFILDKKGTKNTTKYTVSNTAKIINIITRL
ncbi:hypothetical protein [Psychroserpens sp. NJDZ02]|uniref:hypothetical protein n=1 Tax=Psychroserpens sp. NJDZ02 TaxID=2570561 RepID=UPI0010A912D8|nr:hypothetical protein [Psychroserpens sp. NJDZ02]QCE41010.1 hypothetical protein E9099_06120 [Psychroserpens sp. NJDZ02]